MCLQQTFFLWGVIILSMPIWVRFCFGNWFWIPDPLLSEVHSFSCLWLESEGYLSERCLSKSYWFCPSWKPTEVRAVRSQHDRQVLNVGCTCLSHSSLTERSWVLPPCTFLFSDRESPEWNSYSLSGTVTSLFPFLTMHMEAKCSLVPPAWLSEAHKLYSLSTKACFQTCAQDRTLV